MLPSFLFHWLNKYDIQQNGWPEGVLKRPRFRWNATTVGLKHAVGVAAAAFVMEWTEASGGPQLEREEAKAAPVLKLRASIKSTIRLLYMRVYHCHHKTIQPYVRYASKHAGPVECASLLGDP
jgi:hypothetical protein